MTDAVTQAREAQRRLDLNGNRVESKGYVRGDDVIDRAADFVRAALTGAPR